MNYKDYELKIDGLYHYENGKKWKNLQFKFTDLSYDLNLNVLVKKTQLRYLRIYVFIEVVNKYVNQSVSKTEFAIVENRIRS